MTQENLKKSTNAIRDQLKMVAMHAESISPETVHHLWREAGKLHGMVNALKEELAGNPPPKMGG